MTTMETNRQDAKNAKPLPPGWRWVRLGEVSAINPGRSRKFERLADTPTTFIPMAAVDGELGNITTLETKPFAQVARGYTYFEEGDVLFAKITPCMQNKKSAIARGLIGNIGFGTTEFHVIRPGSDITAEWIYYLVREPEFLAAAETHFTGSAGQQRVPTIFLQNCLLPLPPLDEQRAIAARLERDMAEVARLRAEVQRQRQAIDALPGAYLRDVFGSDEARAWPVVRLGDVAKINPSRPKKFQRASDMLTTFIPMAAVDGEIGQVVSSQQRPYAEVERGYTYFQEGDVLFAKITPCMENKKSAVAQHLVDGIGFGTTEFHVIRPESNVTAEWIYYQVREPTFLALAEANFAGAVGQQRVPTSFLAQYEIPLPSLDIQRQIVQRLDDAMAQVQHIGAAAEQQRQAVDALPAVLLREVFGGWES